MHPLLHGRRALIRSCCSSYRCVRTTSSRASTSTSSLLARAHRQASQSKIMHQMAQHLDSRCVLLSDRSTKGTKGAGGKTRLESSKEFKSQFIYYLLFSPDGEVRHENGQGAYQEADDSVSVLLPACGQGRQDVQGPLRRRIYGQTILRYACNCSFIRTRCAYDLISQFCGTRVVALQ